MGAEPPLGRPFVRADGNLFWRRRGVHEPTLAVPTTAFDGAMAKIRSIARQISAAFTDA